MTYDRLFEVIQTLDLGMMLVFTMELYLIVWYILVLVELMGFRKVIASIIIVVMHSYVPSSLKRVQLS